MAPAVERRLCRCVDCPGLREGGNEQLASRQCGDVELVAFAEKDVHPRRELDSRSQPEVRAHAGTPAAHRPVESEGSPQRRVHPVRGYRERRAALHAVDEQTDDPTARDDRGFDGCARSSLHPRRRGRRLEQHAVEHGATLGAAGHQHPVRTRKGRGRDCATEVIANAEERHAPNGRGQPEAFERRDAGRHEPLAAGLLARELAALE